MVLVFNLGERGRNAIELLPRDAISLRVNFPSGQIRKADLQSFSRDDRVALLRDKLILSCEKITSVKNTLVFFFFVLN